MLKKILIFLLIFFVPLIFDPSLQDFVLVKIIFFEAGVLLILFFWFIEILRTKNLIYKITSLNLPVFIFIVFSLGACLTSIHKPTSFFDSYIIHDGFFLNLSYFLFFFFIVNFFSEKEAFSLILAVFITGVLVAIYGIFEFAGFSPLKWGLPSPWGVYTTIGFHNFSAAYLSMAFLSGLGLYFESREKKFLRYFSILGLSLIFLGLIFTESFSGLGGAFLGFLVFSFYLLKLKKINFRDFLIFLGIFLLLVLVFLPFELKKISFQNQFLRLKTNWLIRVETWKATLKMIANYPFSGIGLDTFELVYPRFQTEKFVILSGGKTITHSAHNEILDIAVSRGIFSLIVYFLIIWEIFKKGTEKIRETNSFFYVGTFSAIISYLCQNFFSFGEVSITSLYWLLVAVLFVSSPVKIISLKKIFKWRFFNFLIVLFLIFLICLIFIWFFNIYQADKFFVRAEKAVNSGDFEKAINYYDKSIYLNPLRVEYLIFKAQIYLIKAKNQIDAFLREHILKEGLEIIDRAISLNPEHFATYYLKGLLLDYSENPEFKRQAKSYWMRALRLNPYRPEILELLQ